MAKKNTFTATDPAGVVHTRTSENRTYSFAVVFRYGPQFAAKAKALGLTYFDDLPAEYFTKYHNAGWTSRRDLADKLASSNFHHTPESRALIEDIQVLPAVRKE